MWIETEYFDKLTFDDSGRTSEEQIGMRFVERAKRNRPLGVDCLVNWDVFVGMTRRLNAKVEGEAPRMFIRFHTAAGELRVCVDPDCPPDTFVFVKSTTHAKPAQLEPADVLKALLVSAMVAAKSGEADRAYALIGAYTTLDNHTRGRPMKPSGLDLDSGVAMREVTSAELLRETAITDTLLLNVRCNRLHCDAAFGAHRYVVNIETVDAKRLAIGRLICPDGNMRRLELIDESVGVQPADQAGG